MPRARAQSIIDFSQAIVDGKIAMDSVQPASLFIDSIQKIKGIGPWTANYIAMRHLKHIDAFPQADLGLLKALNLSGKNGKKHLLEYASHWKPFRSYATFLLWNSLAP
jgi:3-methyladenine DNA glycosylase/8-oxoguanine DNA glycosylase